MIRLCHIYQTIINFISYLIICKFVRMSSLQIIMILKHELLTDQILSIDKKLLHYYNKIYYLQEVFFIYKYLLILKSNHAEMLIEVLDNYLIIHIQSVE